MTRKGFEWMKLCDTCVNYHPWDGICIAPDDAIFTGDDGQCALYAFNGLLREREWKYVKNEMDYKAQISNRAFNGSA